MYIYGKNVAYEAIKKGEKIEKAYICNTFNDRFLKSAIQNLKICTVFLTKNELDKLAPKNHQGIILSVPDYKYCNIENLLKEDALIVMLDHIEDPHNLGAIIRTCEAAGVTGIIIPKDRCATINPTVIKVSTGALSNIDVCMVTNLNQAIQKLKKNGFWIIGTDMEGDDYTKLDYKGKTCIIIGNEGSGLSKSIRENCDFVASIQMKGKINSLNASVATGIIVFEAVKQRIGN